MRALNSSIRNAECAQRVLSIVKADLRLLDDAHVGTAFNRLGKMAKSPKFPSRTAAPGKDEILRELLRLARHFAQRRRFMAHGAANTTHGIAKLHEASRLRGILDDCVSAVGTLAALESEAARLAPTMVAQAVANTLWSHATLGKMPGEDALAALEAAAKRVARTLCKTRCGRTRRWGRCSGTIPG